MSAAPPPFPTPTDSQWAAIRAVDRHVLVAAGAGTGKTSTVVGRILYLLGVEIRGERCAAPLVLDEIGAITYTNAAAADLQRKLREALRRAGRRDLACDVDRARIGTIHGFCADLLQEFALRLGRPPGLRILEEGEAAALAAEVVHETVLDAIERGTVEGLDALFAARGVREVEDWIERLVGDGARLTRIAAHRAALGAAERTLVDLAQLARGALERQLGAMGAVDFDCLITWTWELLRRDAHARAALRRRLRVLIVDEFQDVDPAQKAIAYLLGDPVSGGADTTRLMLVGDPKQSIYRFRRADVTVWREVERDFAEHGHGDVVTLAENFRSVAPILGFVDATVGTILDRPIDGERLRDFEVPYHSVIATRTMTASAEPAVELLVVVPAADEKPTADAVRTAEAAAIARRAAELHDAGVAWRDMALVLPTWHALARYEAVLRGAGVPTYALRGDGFYERREVLDLLLALEVMRDPRDDRALFGVLRSPFFGLRDETLLAIAVRGRQPYWDALDEVEVAAAEQPRLARAATVLREHAALRDRVPVDRLLERFLERTGYLAYLYASGSDGDQALANVRKFLRLARQVPGESVGDFLRAARERRARGDREGDARLYNQGEDVFTLTSTHSAKGLEWRIVFWGDMIWSPPRFGEPLVVGREHVALNDPDAASDAQPLHWRRLVQEEEAEQAAERKRLWYVAATRARERLVVTGLCPAKRDVKSTGSLLMQTLGAIPDEDGAFVEYRGRDGAAYASVTRVVSVDYAAMAGPEGTKASVLSRPIPESLPPLVVADS